MAQAGGAASPPVPQLAQAGELLDEVHCRLGMCEDRRLSDVGSQAQKEKLER